MIYKITGVFRNTEDAQSAARRINSGVDNIYEIRMNYLTRDEDFGLLNNILYSPPAMSVISGSYYKYPAENSSVTYRTDNTRVSAFDYGETCKLSILASDKTYEKVQSIMHNQSGYDVKATIYEE